MEFFKLIPNWLKKVFNRPKNIAFILLCLLIVQTVALFQYRAIQNEYKMLWKTRSDFFKEKYETQNKTNESTKRTDDRTPEREGTGAGGIVGEQRLDNRFTPDDREVNSSEKKEQLYKNEKGYRTDEYLRIQNRMIELTHEFDSLDTELYLLLKTAIEYEQELLKLKNELRELEKQERIQRDDFLREEEKGIGGGEGGGAGVGTGDSKTILELASKFNKTGSIYLCIVIFIGILELILIPLFIIKTRS